MRITEIAIENFRSLKIFDHSNIPRVLSIAGPNGAGKSSVIYALQYALFGRCEHTSRSGQGAAQLIRHGAQRAVIEVTFMHRDMPCILTAEIIRKGKTCEVAFGCVVCDTGECYETREAMWLGLGVDMAVAEAAAMPRAWMCSKDASKLLSGLMVSDDIAASMLAFLGPVRKWFEDYMKVPFEHLSQFRHAGDELYSLRTSVKADLKKAKGELEDLPFVALPKNAQGKELEADDLQGLQADVQMVTEKRDAAIKQQGAQTVLEALGKIDEFEREYSLGLTAYDAEHAKMAKMRAEIAELEGSAESSAETWHSRIEALGTELSCATCGQGLGEDKIRTREEKRVSLKRSLKAALEIDEKLARLYPPHNAATKAKNEARARADTARRDIDRWNNQRAELEASNLWTAEELPSKTAEYTDHVTRGHDLIARLEACIHRSGLETYIDATERKVKAMTTCIDAYKGGKAENAIVAEQLDPFMERVNTRLGGWHGLRLGIAPEGKDLVFFAESEISEGATPYPLLSQGEQTRIAYEVSTELAAGLAPVMLDDANHLDGETRNDLIADLELDAEECGASSVIIAWADQDGYSHQSKAVSVYLKPADTAEGATT